MTDTPAPDTTTATMTVDEAISQVADVLAQLRATQAVPAAAVDPDGYPSHVAAGELIESAWGNAVVDTLRGLGVRRARIVSTTTDGTGAVWIPFDTPFPTAVDAVTVVDYSPAGYGAIVIRLTQANVNGFGFLALNPAGGVYAALAMQISYIAVGR